MGVVARATSSSPLSLPSPKRASVATHRRPCSGRVVRDRREHAVGRAVGRHALLPLEQAHPEREVDEVVGVEVGRRARAARPSRAAGEVAADERAADEQLDGLRRLVLVARGGGVRPLERALRGLRGAEAVEHARQHALDARARVAVLRAARLHEPLERLGQRRARRGDVALVARDVARS